VGCGLILKVPTSLFSQDFALFIFWGFFGDFRFLLGGCRMKRQLPRGNFRPKKTHSMSAFSASVAA